ncbi:tetratricopeptide repeat protein [Limnospira platensis]|uniref:tetratricopeptide repeat protein n=1 Tax=Limnospira platensis TaxID=118562 RepID=UPI0021AA5070|nr:Tetratricopeptide repeat-containing protein [Arthrospira platensis C1]
MSAGELLRQANQLKRSGKLDEAIALYHQVVDINPHFAWAYHGLGDALAKQGNLDEAVACYSEGLKINTHSAWLFYSLGEALAELGDLEAAVEYLQKAIELKPDCYKFYNTLGWVFSKQKKFDYALNYYEQAIRLNPKMVYGYLGCCCIYLYLGDLFKAEDSFKLALIWQPTNQKVKLYEKFFRIIFQLDKKIKYNFNLDIKMLIKNANQHQKKVDIWNKNKDFLQILNIVQIYEDISENKDLMIPELSEFHFIISQITLEGIDYIEILKRLHKFLNPRTYVEIGIETGRSFNLAHSSTLSIGIDPKPRLTNPIKPNSKIFCQTSDEFFQNFNLFKECKGYQLDFAFIDGATLI